MKMWATVTVLLVLGVFPAKGQQPADQQNKRATLTSEIEFLELEQDVDKTLLREAMLLLGRERLKPTLELPNPEDEAKRVKAVESTLKSLVSFIKEKEDALTRRTVQLRRKKAELTRPAIPQRASSRTQAGQPVADDKEKQELIEKMVEAQIEIQLLQMQSQMYQQTLNEVINTLATAEFAASIDPTQQDKANAARKQFDKTKARYVEFSKRLQLEQSKMGDLQGSPGGMGGFGMGGMGGGMR